MMKRFLILAFLLIAAKTEAAPVVSSVTTSGSTAIVTGTGFGTPRTADYFNYFDYSSEWSCDQNSSCDAQCNNTFPTAPAGQTAMKLWCSTGDGTYQTGSGTPLHSITQDISNFSTGRSYRQYLKYYSGGVGALPNSNMAPTPAISAATEFWAIGYVYWGPEWNQNPNFEKIFGTWSGNANNFGMIVDGGDGKLDFQVGQISGDNASIDAPSGSAISRAGKWHEVKLHVKKQTAGNTDGVVQEYVDGNLIINDSTAKPIGDSYTFFNSSAHSGFTFGENAQCGGTGIFTCPGVGNAWVRAYDDYFLNLSSTDPCGGVYPCVATVYLSNSATWGTGPTDKLNGDSNFVRQKVGGSADADLGFKSWSNTGVKFEVNTTGLNTSAPLYLYASDWSGNVNINGYPVVQPGTLKNIGTTQAVRGKGTTAAINK